MLAFSDIIDFLLRLLSDADAQAEFEQDPQGTLERAGLEGITAQDVRDARLQLADSGAVSAVDDGTGSTYPDGDDPVREIGYTTRHYVADENVDHDDAGHTDPDLVDRGGAFVTIDDRDTLFFQSVSDDDVTVIDNSVAITDSFDQDNSVTDVTAIQANGSFNSDDDTSIDAENSFNTDDDVVAIQDNDGGDGGDGPIVVDTGAPAVPAAADPLPVDLPPDVDDEPVDDAPVDDEPVDDEPVADAPVDDDADLAADDSDAAAV